MSFQSDSNDNNSTQSDSEVNNTQNTNYNQSQQQHHDEKQYKKGKKKGLPEVDPNAPCHILRLSFEVLAHIFARLDPVSLATVAKVCHYWKYMVTDDTCWRDAFVSYFGCLPYKRLSTESWKTEYILRTHLLRKWTKGRGTVVSFNPKVGSIDGMHVDFEEYMMIAASKQDGIAAKCNPTTGKIDRHYLYCTNESIRTMVTAVKVDKNRILWGFGQGFITLSIRTKSSGASSNRLKVFSEFHHGPVRIVELPSFNQEVVVSGSDDGTVKIWDVTSATCAHTLHGSSGAVPTSLKVSVDQYILAGYDNGYIAVWNIHLGHIIKGHRRRQYLTQEELDKKKILVPPPTKERGASVTDIIYDPDSGTFIASYSGLTSVYKYNVSTGERVAVFEGGHDLANSITCIQWDRSSLSSALSLESAVKPNPLKKKGGIIDLSSSRSSSGTSTPVVNQLPVKTTRLLVTGDNTGSLCLWNSDDMTQDGSIIKPLCVLNGHIYAISAIYIDACKIVTGSDDGWIYVWDPLTGTILHTLGNKIPKNAPVDRTDVQVMRVKNLICNDYQGVATIGHQVKSWDFSPGKQFSNRRPLKPKVKSCSNIMRDRIRYDIHCEVKDSLSKMASEKVERERESKVMDKLTLGGLTDQEMLEYAMMLSQENHEPAQGDFVDEQDEELMQAMIESMNFAENQGVYDENTGMTNDELYAESSNSNSNSSSNNNNNNSSDDDGIWPTISESMDVGSGSSQAEEEEEMDEELRYILELSKTVK